VLERHLAHALDDEVEVVTHLESIEDHAAVHPEQTRDSTSGDHDVSSTGRFAVR